MGYREPSIQQIRQAEQKLVRAVRKLDELRSIMRARKIAGILSDEDLRTFMEVDAEVEIVLLGLQTKAL
jgi:hypothetical protein